MMRHSVNRRALIRLGAGAAALVIAPALAMHDALAQSFDEIAAQTLGRNRHFVPSAIIDTARALSRLPYTPPDSSLPPRFQDLDYDRYIRIQSNPDAALFREGGAGFAVEPLHRGFVFSSAVALHVIEDGIIRRLAYDANFFRYNDIGRPDDGADLGFSGFRILAGKGNDLVEQAIFQGSTYFRAIATGQSLGAMARGISVRTSEPGGEEFPAFRSFFIEQPIPGEPLIIHAIADSESLSAAFRFAFRPGNMAFIDTEMTVFARSEIANFGIGGLQSTYFFGPNDRQGIDDLRVAAYENDGIQMHRGNGEWLWRPVSNPADLQISAFVDEAPKGFGLLQRQRQLSSFEDDNQGFEKRPSVMIEPVGDWGKGAVELIEIPTQSDINDNIIVFWRPQGVLNAGDFRRFAYRQTWCWSPPLGPAGPIVLQSRSGLGNTPGTRRFLVEFGGESLKIATTAQIGITLSASTGRIIAQRLRHNAQAGIARLVFEVENQGAPVVELRASLQPAGQKASETWLYRWTA
jgi:periplasmic glucans biosynthesis protein